MTFCPEERASPDFRLSQFVRESAADKLILDTRLQDFPVRAGLLEALKIRWDESLHRV